MINLIITLFIFILLVTQKILLLNEESLILLCFITFIFLGITNLGTSLSNSLNSQSKQIQINLSNSLIKLINLVNNLINFNKNYELIFTNFNKYKNYYKKLSILLSSLLLNYNKCNIIWIYKKKLVFLTKIEDQTLKLLGTIILKKLNNVIKLRYFYTSSIKVYQFNTIHTILLRECIQLVNKTII